MSDSNETILSRLLADIDDSYDKTDGSFFYDAEMPVAIELASAYAKLDSVLDNGFPDTATSIYLDKIVSEQGLTRKAAGYATTTVTITGTAGASIPSGGLVSTDVLDFAFNESVTIGSDGTTSVTVQCTTAGAAGNVAAGAIKYFPVTIAGLTAVTNPAAVTNGYDEETDVELRARYYAKVQAPSTSGNKNDYVSWAASVTGCGAAKCFPLWNGNGTVKVCLIDSNKQPASSALVSSVQTYIESVRPIGAMVTYEAATALNINVAATLSCAAGYTAAGLNSAVTAAITAYLQSIAFIQNYVSYAQIGNAILGVAGILDYSDLTVNGGTVNITIGDEQVAVIGSVVVG